MIWTWTQPVRPSCVQFSLLVNQASFTDAPAARSKESAVCPENQLFIIYHLGPKFIVNWLIFSRLTSHFWIASIFHSFTLTKVLPASIPACRWDRKFSKNKNILTLSQKCLNFENASPFLPDWTWPPYSRRAQPCPQVPPCTSSSRMMILAQRNGYAIWGSCRCSRKLSMVEGRFSKWF